MVSNKLAAILKRARVSTDELIEKREGRSITEVFEQSGEQYFRRLEKEVVEEIAQKENLILDCGGGIVLEPENLASLKKNGIVFYLAASPQTLYQRIKDQTHRPLLSGPATPPFVRSERRDSDPQSKIKELLDQRRILYQQAHHTIDTNHRSVEEIAQEVLKTAHD